MMLAWLTTTAIKRLDSFALDLSNNSFAETPSLLLVLLLTCPMLLDQLVAAAKTWWLIADVGADLSDAARPA